MTESCRKVQASLLAAAAAMSPELKLELFLSESWGSQNKNNRIELRQKIADVESTRISSPRQGSRLLDLSVLPQSSVFNISVSHTQSVGGFALCSKDFLCGFDLELVDRVTPKVAARVASSNEINLVPHTAAIWVIKEAAFKALSKLSIVNVINQIEIVYSAALASDRSASELGEIFAASVQTSTSAPPVRASGWWVTTPELAASIMFLKMPAART